MLDVKSDYEKVTLTQERKNNEYDYADVDPPTFSGAATGYEVLLMNEVFH